MYFCTFKQRGARVVEEARLESVYAATHRGFESLSLCNISFNQITLSFILSVIFFPHNIKKTQTFFYSLKKT